MIVKQLSSKLVFPSNKGGRNKWIKCFIVDSSKTMTAVLEYFHDNVIRDYTVLYNSCCY